MKTKIYVKPPFLDGGCGITEYINYYKTYGYDTLEGFSDNSKHDDEKEYKEYEIKFGSFTNDEDPHDENGEMPDKYWDYYEVNGESSNNYELMYIYTYLCAN